MEYGIQRRSIYLAPPDNDDLVWFFAQFDDPEIWEMFGLRHNARLRIMRSFRSGNIVVGIIRRAETRKRIGFTVVFPPFGDLDFWEFGYAISSTLDRDAYSALHATDAMAHYMFEHLKVPSVGWRTREDNDAADAIVRRLGYEPYRTAVLDGHKYTFYRLDREGWDARRRKLDLGEERHPSGTGGTFVTLPEPFLPIVPEPNDR